MIIATWNRYFLPFSTLSCRSILRALSSANNGTNIMCLYVRMQSNSSSAHDKNPFRDTYSQKSDEKKNQTKNHLLHSQQLRVNTNFDIKCHGLLLCELLVYFCLFSSDSLSLYETKFINLEFSLWEEVKICATCQQ